MAEVKPYLPPKGNKPKELIDENKGQATNSKKYRGNKNQTKYQCLDPKDDTKFKGLCSDMEGYIYGLRSSDKSYKKTKELGWHLKETYIDICQPSLMTETTAILPNPDMPTIIPNTGVECPKRTYI